MFKNKVYHFSEHGIHGEKNRRPKCAYYRLHFDITTVKIKWVKNVFGTLID